MALAKKRGIQPVVFHAQHGPSYYTSMVIDPLKSLCTLISRPMTLMQRQNYFAPQSRVEALQLYKYVQIPPNVSLLPHWQVKRLLGIT